MNANTDLRKKYCSFDEYLKYHGKFVIYAELEDLKEKIKLIISKLEHSKWPEIMKVSQRPAFEIEIPCKNKENLHVLIIYCDEREKQEREKQLGKDILGDCYFFKKDALTLCRLLNEGEKLLEIFDYWKISEEKGIELISKYGKI